MATVGSQLQILVLDFALRLITVGLMNDCELDVMDTNDAKEQNWFKIRVT
ncbi:hypothetical protein [Enterococcus faecalis]|nr:hypothetical protein [Enterococcus faecalis]